MPPMEPPVAAKPVAEPRDARKKWPIAEIAGVKMSEVPIPPSIENVMRKCQYSTKRLALHGGEFPFDLIVSPPGKIHQLTLPAPSYKRSDKHYR